MLRAVPDETNTLPALSTLRTPTLGPDSGSNELLVVYELRIKG